MTKARDLADIISGAYDVPVGALGNVPPSDDASALTTGTLPIARIADGAVTAAKLASGSAASNIGYTPVNKAGDTMTGSLNLSTAGFSGGLVSTATTGDTATRWRLSRNTSTGQAGKDWYVSCNTDSGAFAVHEGSVGDAFNVTPGGRFNLSSQGLRFSQGVYEAGTSCLNNDVASTRTFKILRMNTWYWGEGGTLVEIYKHYYSGFDYAAYVLTGHTNRGNNGPGVTTKISGSGTPSFNSTIYESGDSNSAGYADLVISVGNYLGYRIKVTSANPIYALDGSASNFTWNTNRIWMYPQNTLA